MIFQKLFIVMVLGCLAVGPCLAQDDKIEWTSPKQYIMRPDGSYAALIPDEDFWYYTGKVGTFSRNYLKETGIGEILKLFVDEISVLLDMELVADQKKELSEILDNYRDAVAKLDDRDADGLIYLTHRYVNRVNNTLLPEQFESIAKKTSRTNRLFSLLVYSGEAKSLEISDSQKQQIVEECRHLNDAIKKTTAELEAKIKLHHQEALAIYERVLSVDQKAKIAKRMDAEQFIQKMILPDLDADTDLKEFKK